LQKAVDIPKGSTIESLQKELRNKSIGRYFPLLVKWHRKKQEMGKFDYEYI